MAVVNATTLENSRLSGQLEDALLGIKQMLQMVEEAVGRGAIPAWAYTVRAHVDAIDDAFVAYHSHVFDDLLPLVGRQAAGGDGGMGGVPPMVTSALDSAQSHARGDGVDIHRQHSRPGKQESATVDYVDNSVI